MSALSKKLKSDGIEEIERKWDKNLFRGALNAI